MSGVSLLGQGYVYSERCASTMQDACTASGVPAPGCVCYERPWCAGIVKDVCHSYHALLSDALFQVRCKYPFIVL